MRIVYMGTPGIAATCLERLCQENHEIVGVYTKIDTPSKRGMKLQQSEVKQTALVHGLTVYQPETFRDDAVYEELKALEPDLIACVAYGKILPQRVLDIPRLGCVNIHASILPTLRGAGPIQWSILNGCDETGVTAMYMAKEMDAGDIIEIVKTPIEPFETGEELTLRLADLGAELLVKTVNEIASGNIRRTPQEHDKATYAPMLTKELCPIDWAKNQRQIVDQVRGLIPWPVATTELGGKRFKIYRVEPVEGETEKEPGKLLELNKKGLVVACGAGKKMMITELQAEGGKRMRAVDYFRGHPIDLD